MTVDAAPKSAERRQALSEVSLGMAACGLGGGALRRCCSADSLCERACELPRHFYHSRIRGNAIQHRQEAFGLRECPLPQIVFELMQCVIHSQAVVLQPLLQQRKIALLLKKALKDERQLLRRAV